MPNRLSGERSPYLLQHADNPVEWYPWGDEALTRAQQENKPILVSIGYASCHWCHVMAHESFENRDIARLMNDLFVNIKVDREERPDLDAIFMEAVQALTGQGGWPLNVFLTSDSKPFYGGTYFPPEPRHGMPSWPQLLENIAAAYRNHPGEIQHDAETLSAYVRKAQRLQSSPGELTTEVLDSAYQEMSRQFDWTNGGFGGAPKFPQPLALAFLLRMSRRGRDEAQRFVVETLRHMARGGIFDQLGGGFHRYSVDTHWLVPHFEKMLYDNALLAEVYLHAYQVTGDIELRAVTEATLDYILRDLRSPVGGFYSSQDADSEGEEGKYYVWTPAEVESILGPENARVALLTLGITARGNFEGSSILTRAKSLDELAQETGLPRVEIEERLNEALARMLAARSHRVPPATDTKIITSWNALAIDALARAGAALRRDDYLTAARDASDFILSAMRPDGKLVRSYREGPSHVPGFLEDYSYLAGALLSLSAATFEATYFRSAIELVDEMVQTFWDDAQGAFFDSPAGLDEPVARPRSFFDNPIPSGNSAASLTLLRLNALTGNEVYDKWAVPAFRATRDLIARAPLGFAHMLSALDFYLAQPIQVAIVGDPVAPDTAALSRAVFERFLPNAVVSVGASGSLPLLENRQVIDGRATAYVCRDFACRLPVTETAALNEELDLAASGVG